MVQAEVARQFGLHVNDLRGDKRSQDIAYARQIAMYLARDLTEASLPQIGDRFGGRHHTTVIYAVDKIERQLKDGHDRQLHELVQVISVAAQDHPLDTTCVTAAPADNRSDPWTIHKSAPETTMLLPTMPPTVEGDARFCTLRPQGSADEPSSERAGRTSSLHIVNRRYDDDEEISLLLKYIRSRDETQV